MSIPVNHRRVEYAGLTTKKELQGVEVSLEDLMTSDSGTSTIDHACFIFPYEVAHSVESFDAQKTEKTTPSTPMRSQSPARRSGRSKSPRKDKQSPAKDTQSTEKEVQNPPDSPAPAVPKLPDIPLQTLLEGNYCVPKKVQEEQKEGEEAASRITEVFGTVQFTNVCYQSVTQDTYVSALKLFDRPASRFAMNLNNNKESFFDFRPLFDLPDLPTGRSMAEIKAFVTKYNIPMEIKDDMYLTEAIHCLRHTIQSLTPLRFAFLEGNHRMEIAVRKLYGIPVAHLTKDYKVSESLQPDQYPETCALFQQISLKMVQYNTDSVEIKPDKIEELRNLSTVITEEKALKVDSTLRQFLLDAREALDKDHLFKQDMKNCVDFMFYPKPNIVKYDQCKHNLTMIRAVYVVRFLLEQMKKHEATKTKYENAERIYKSKDQDSKDQDLLSSFPEKVFKYYLEAPYVYNASNFPEYNEVKKANQFSIFEYNYASIFWLFHVFSSHKEAWDFFLKFLRTTRRDIISMDYMLLYVLPTTNKIGLHMSKIISDFVKTHKEMFPIKGTITTATTNMIKHYFRLSYAHQYLNILMKFGTSPTFNKKGPMKKLAKWLEGSRFKYDPTSKREICNNESLAYGGITQVILLCFPRYVLQTFVEYLKDLLEAWEAKKRNINTRLDDLSDDVLLRIDPADGLDEDEKNDHLETTRKRYKVYQNRLDWLDTFKSLFPELQDGTYLHPKTGRSPDGTFKPKIPENEVFNVLIPTRCRLSSARFKDILNGGVDTRKWIDQYAFHSDTRKELPSGYTSECEKLKKAFEKESTRKQPNAARKKRLRSSSQPPENVENVSSENPSPKKSNKKQKTNPNSSESESLSSGQSHSSREESSTNKRKKPTPTKPNNKAGLKTTGLDDEDEGDEEEEEGSEESSRSNDSDDSSDSDSEEEDDTQPVEDEEEPDEASNHPEVLEIPDLPAQVYGNIAILKQMSEWLANKMKKKPEDITNNEIQHYYKYVDNFIDTIDPDGHHIEIKDHLARNHEDLGFPRPRIKKRTNRYGTKEGTRKLFAKKSKRIPRKKARPTRGRL